MSDRSDGPARRRTRSRARRRGATTGSGRPGSCSDPRSGAAATVAGRRAEKAARRGLVDWPEVERIAIGRLRAAPGTLDPAELRAAEPAYAEAMARIVPALSAALGQSAAGRRRAVRRRRSGRLGPRQHRVVRVAHGQARDRPARPGHPARRRPRQGDDGARQPLGHDAPARLPARLHGHAASSASTTSRCCPPRRPRAVSCSSRRTSARRPVRWACRSARSGPGSRSTRRPTPSSSRRIPGCGRTSPNASSAS